MLFDTDVLIWVERGNPKASLVVENADERSISLQTYLELLQGANNARQQSLIKDFLRQFNFKILPLTENIGHRAAIYIEEYSLSVGLRAGDALIAATATEHNLLLVSANKKHFKPIKNLSFKMFVP